MSNVGEVFGNLVTGNIFGAFKSMVNESPQENIREAVVDILNGKKVEENREKLCKELQRSGGDREKMAQVDQLMGDMAQGKADETSTMEQILLIVGAKDADRMGITPSNVRGKSVGCVEF